MPCITSEQPWQQLQFGRPSSQHARMRELQPCTPASEHLRGHVVTECAALFQSCAVGPTRTHKPQHHRHVRAGSMHAARHGLFLPPGPAAPAPTRRLGGQHQLFSGRPDGHVASRAGASTARTSASASSSRAVSGAAADATLARTWAQPGPSVKALS